jgi:hypothetical protein
MVAGAAAPAAVMAGAYYMAPPLFFIPFYLFFFSNIYMHSIVYLEYFNEKTPRVPKVPRVLFDTT